MNINLSYSAQFSTINVSSDRIYPNLYTCQFKLVTTTENARYQNIAFERLQFFIDQILNKSIVIIKDHPLYKSLTDFSTYNIMELPDDVYDHIVGLALFCKINTILNENLLLEELTLTSIDNSNLGYKINSMSNFGPFEETNQSTKKMPWWSREDLSISDLEIGPHKLTWQDLGLTWDEEAENDDFEIDFEPDPSILKDKGKKKDRPVSNINATIITGGKDTDNDKED